MSVLDKTQREYLKNLKPVNIPDWKTSWQEGYALGESITPIQTPFLKKHGLKSEVEFRMEQAKKGKVTWKINMGLSSIDEHVEALKSAQKFNEETGLNISCAHQLPKNIYGTPKEMRKGLPAALGFDLEKEEDWQKITTASDIQATFGDQHLGEPNSVEMTKGSLKAGSSYQGMFGHFQWSVPGCPDDVWNMNEIVKGMGMVAAHYDGKVVVDSAVDDSLPAYCSDFASYIAWGKVEQYLVSELGKCRYAISFGNFASDLIVKTAMWYAAHHLFGKKDQPGIGFVYANTVDHWDHHLHSNYGFQVPEALMCVLMERRFHTGATYLSVPITEKVTIPTVEEMLDMTGACQRTEGPADAFEKLIDWTPVIELGEKVIVLANQFFENFLEGFREAGIDITNPIEIMVVLKRMDPAKFEEFFHPSIVNEGKKNVVPLMPTTLWLQSSNVVDNLLKKYYRTSIHEGLKGKRICIASADIHYFGAYTIKKILEALGAEVVDGGNEMEAIDVLDLAKEYNIKNIVISVHNGQAYDYAKLISDLKRKRNEDNKIFMGGYLLSLLGEGCKEPVDVTNEIKSMGIITNSSMEQLLEQLSEA